MTETDPSSSIDQSLANTVTADRLYGLLSHSHRRFVLRELARREGPATIESLVEELATSAGEAPESTGKRPREVRIGLYHVHLPKLAEAGLVEFDPETSTVAPPEEGPGPASLAPLLGAKGNGHRRE